MPILNCAEGLLTPYQPSGANPWNQQKANHLIRRIMLGANPVSINSVLDENPTSLVNRIITTAKNLPLAPEPAWSNWQLSDYSPDQTTRNEQFADQYITWGTQWVRDIKNNGLRDRMSFFWHNHFVTRLDDYYCPSWMYDYHRLLQKHALGNFKEFVTEIGICPAMLLFLNGVQNTVFNPNENFARELLELFTLGVDNGYTQNDIVEAARALTGWNGIDVDNLCGTVEFIPGFWDSGSKTIFGKTGNYNYFELIDLLFEERPKEISEYICGKIYKHFVNPKVDELIIEQMGKTFRDNNWEIAPVLNELFSSEHFFDIANIGTIIPGHLEYSLMFLNEIGYEDNDEILYAIVASNGEYDQRLFNPPNVAGWEGNRAWINSASLPYRWEIITNLMAYYYGLQNESLVPLINFVKNIAGEDETDPAVITKLVVDFFVPKGLQFDLEYDEATVVFKWEVPQNYFDLGIWSLNHEFAPVQAFYLINHIANLPEFQLK